MTETQSLRPGTVKVGDGVTMRVGSDRYAGTVTYVSPSGKTFRWTHDEATVTKPVAYGEQCDYSYESVPERTGTNALGEPWTNAQTARWSAKQGRFVSGGCGMLAGRHHYMDPSF